MSSDHDTGAGVYGRRLAENFSVEQAPFIVTRTLQRAEVAVTEVRLDAPTGGLSDPLPREDAWLVTLALRDYQDNLYWEDGRQAPVTTIRAGDSLVHDLRRAPLMLIDKPLHSLLFYLPRTALDVLADEAGAPHIDDLDYVPGAGVEDATVRGLGMPLLPAMQTPEQVSRVFMDHVTLALAAHIAQAYGGMRAVERPAQGGLAPWQERRAKELLGADLTGSVPLAEVAQACGLSTSHFSRAFHRSTGLAPHAWLLWLRVETAKTMLRQREAPLAAIAIACGFADQSHFTRVFVRHVRLTPGAWRRALSD